MDRLTHKSITNCIKELDAIEKLILSQQFDYTEIADWVSEISWNLANIFRRTRYDSDEYQCLLKKIVQQKQREGIKNKKGPSKDWREDD